MTKPKPRLPDGVSLESVVAERDRFAVQIQRYQVIVSRLVAANHKASAACEKYRNALESLQHAGAQRFVADHLADEFDEQTIDLQIAAEEEAVP